MHNNLEEFRAGTQTPPQSINRDHGGQSRAEVSTGSSSEDPPTAALPVEGVLVGGPPVVATPVELAFRVTNSRDRSGD